MPEPSIFDAIDDNTPEPTGADAAPAPEPAPSAEPTAAAPAPAAEPVAAAPAPTPPAPEPERTVPLAALLAQRREAEEKIRAAEARAAELEARLKAPPAPPPPEPDFMEDPKAYTDAKVASALKELEAAKTAVTEELGKSRAELDQIRLAQTIEAAEVQMVQQAPDLRDALIHCRNVRYQQLKLSAPEASDEQIVAFIGQEERALAAREIAQGRNPYAYIYQVAKTMGYQPKAAPAPAPAPAAPAGNGAKPPAAGAKPGTLPPDTTLPAGGGAPDIAPTSEDIESDDNPNAILHAALAERFGRRRA